MNWQTLVMVLNAPVAWKELIAVNKISKKAIQMNMLSFLLREKAAHRNIAEKNTVYNLFCQSCGKRGRIKSVTRVKINSKDVTHDVARQFCGINFITMCFLYPVSADPPEPDT
jgi:hypothetical protein